MKRGFTLVEVLATIAILGILGIVIAVSFNNLSDKQDASEFEKFETQLESAACAYIELSVDTRKSFGAKNKDMKNLSTKSYCKTGVGSSQEKIYEKYLLKEGEAFNATGCKIPFSDLLYSGLVSKDLTYPGGYTFEEIVSRIKEGDIPEQYVEIHWNDAMGVTIQAKECYFAITSFETNGFWGDDAQKDICRKSFVDYMKDKDETFDDSKYCKFVK